MKRFNGVDLLVAIIGCVVTSTVFIISGTTLTEDYENRPRELTVENYHDYCSFSINGTMEFTYTVRLTSQVHIHNFQAFITLYFYSTAGGDEANDEVLSISSDDLTAGAYLEKNAVASMSQSWGYDSMTVTSISGELD